METNLKMVMDMVLLTKLERFHHTTGFGAHKDSMTTTNHLEDGLNGRKENSFLILNFEIEFKNLQRLTMLTKK